MNKTRKHQSPIRIVSSLNKYCKYPDNKKKVSVILFFPSATFNKIIKAYKDTKVSLLVNNLREVHKDRSVVSTSNNEY